MDIQSINAGQNVYQTQNIETSKVNPQVKVDLNNPVDTVEFNTKEKPSKEKASTGKKNRCWNCFSFPSGIRSND